MYHILPVRITIEDLQLHTVYILTSINDRSVAKLLRLHKQVPQVTRKNLSPAGCPALLQSQYEKLDREVNAV